MKARMRTAMARNVRQGEAWERESWWVQSAQIWQWAKVAVPKRVGGVDTIGEALEDGGEAPRPKMR